MCNVKTNLEYSSHRAGKSMMPHQEEELPSPSSNYESYPASVFSTSNSAAKPWFQFKGKSPGDGDKAIQWPRGLHRSFAANFLIAKISILGMTNIKAGFYIVERHKVHDT